MDGLLAQEYGNYPAGSEVMQNLMSPNMVVNQALDFIERRKQQDLRSKYNELMLDKAQQMSPLDLLRQKQLIDIESAKQDPRYREGYIQNMEGTGASNKAAGDLSKATTEEKIKAALLELKNKSEEEALLKRRFDLINGGKGPSGTIGFPVTRQGQPTPTGWQIPPEVQASRDQGRLGILEQESKLYPDDPNLKRELENERKKQAISSTVTTRTPTGQDYSLSGGSDEYERIMAALTDSPKLRQELIKGSQRGDISETLKLMQLEAAARTAAQRGEKPLTLSQMEAKYRDILARDPKNEEAIAFLKELEGYKQRTAAGMADVTLKDGQLKTKRDVLSSESATPKEYNYVPGKGLVPAQ